MGGRLDTASIPANTSLPSALGRGRGTKKALLIHTPGVAAETSEQRRRSPGACNYKLKEEARRMILTRFCMRPQW